jgi:hypothetical protein
MARSTFSIGGVEFSVARLVLPGTDSEATIVVGEMALVRDTPGRRSSRVVVIGTAVQDVRDESDARTDIRIQVEPDVAPDAADAPRSKLRKSRQRRRHGVEG